MRGQAGLSVVDVLGDNSEDQQTGEALEQGIHTNNGQRSLNHFP